LPRELSAYEAVIGLWVVLRVLLTIMIRELKPNLIG
jgi:hypothetical protein